MIIFDFNGTIVFDSPYHFKAWYEFSKIIRGNPMDEKELEASCHGRVNKEIIKYLDPSLSDEKCEELSKEKEALYREIAANDKDYKLADGLEKYFNYLKENKISINIASASIKENIDFFIDYFKLANWFDPKKIKYDDGTYKDKKKMFIDAAKVIGADIRDCIIFEDSTSGVKCANDIKAKKVIVICEKEREKDFKDLKVDFFIRDFNDERVYSILQESN